MPRVVETPLRVRYAETDRMGIVYHAHYIVWFEIGRTEYCRAAGLPYRAMEDAGLLILVTGVDCTYRRPARYDDAIRVRAGLEQLGSRGMTFAYEIVRGEDEMLADGSTRHVFADSAGRPRRAPDDVVERLARFRDAPTGQDDFGSPVERAAGGRRVRLDGVVLAEAADLEPGLVHLAGGEIVGDGLGALERQPQVVLVASGRVGVPADEDLRLREVDVQDVGLRVQDREGRPASGRTCPRRRRPSPSSRR